MMKLANCNEHHDLNRRLACWALRHDDGRRVTADEMWMIIQSMPNLDPVIFWLENGCDPKEAAKKLRIDQMRMDQRISAGSALEPIVRIFD